MYPPDLLAHLLSADHLVTTHVFSSNGQISDQHMFVGSFSGQPATCAGPAANQGEQEGCGSPQSAALQRWAESLEAGGCQGHEVVAMHVLDWWVVVVIVLLIRCPVVAVAFGVIVVVVVIVAVEVTGVLWLVLLFGCVWLWG